MKKVLVIVGPTAIGKTSFSVDLAKQFNGEIISGDSIQVYRGLDIGSGKVKKEEMQEIPHYGIDILEADDEYHVYAFQKMARKAIDEISDKGKLPIIVGGTGLYIKACLYDYVFEEQEPLDLSIYQQQSSEVLYAKLLEIDPKSCEQIHGNNRKRVIRALAMAEQGKTKSSLIASQTHQCLYDAMIVGLTAEREIVYDRINRRVKMMVDEGLVEEIQGLLDKGVRFEHQSMQGIGYREFQGYFNNQQSLVETIELIQRNTRRFAKRQYTWFNNQTPIHWIDIVNLEQGKKDVEKWINNTNE
ncbi:MAG: tRNA (adenosine(37)-N6)-dimethylallyltransferase MiaA [Erysipelotrichaceae bacterium]